MLHQLDDIAALAAAAAVPQTLRWIHCKSVIATTTRTRPDVLGSDPLEPNAVQLNHLLDGHSTRAVDPSVAIIHSVRSSSARRRNEAAH
jgi:hypothetical protein